MENQITYNGLKEYPELKASLLHSINMMKMVIEADKMDLADIASNMINRASLITEFAHEVYAEHEKQQGIEPEIETAEIWAEAQTETITITLPAAKQLFFHAAVEAFNLGVNEGAFPEEHSLFEEYNKNIEQAFIKCQNNPDYWSTLVPREPISD